MTKSYSEGWIDCPECGGKGEVEVERYSRMSSSNAYGDIYVTIEVCECCHGNGYVSDPNDET
jgi:DnaJ-class molecular chaperone